MSEPEYDNIKTMCRWIDTLDLPHKYIKHFNMHSTQHSEHTNDKEKNRSCQLAYISASEKVSLYRSSYVRRVLSF